MRNKLFAGIALLGAFVFSALAADVSGKWVADVPGRGGQTMQQTFDLKSDGSALTGTITGPRGETPIADGKVDGDNISFTTTVKFGDNEMKMLFNGKVKGDQIDFTREMQGGQGRKQEFTAKKTTT